MQRSVSQGTKTFRLSENGVQNAGQCHKFSNVVNSLELLHVVRNVDAAQDRPRPEVTKACLFWILYLNTRSHATVFNVDSVCLFLWLTQLISCSLLGIGSYYRSKRYYHRIVHQLKRQ